jgi:hypothetical protein
MTVKDASEFLNVARSTIDYLEKGEFKKSEVYADYEKLLLDSLEYESRKCSLAKALLDHVKEQA